MELDRVEQYTALTTESGRCWWGLKQIGTENDSECSTTNKNPFFFFDKNKQKSFKKYSTSHILFLCFYVVYVNKFVVFIYITMILFWWEFFL